jgi:putative FmdB family regulatory protein
MPIYDFVCESCGARFEELVPAGTESAPCGACGHEHTRRAYSPQAATPRLVKSPGGARRQERENAKLRERAKADFSRRRKAARGRAPGGEGA